MPDIRPIMNMFVNELVNYGLVVLWELAKGGGPVDSKS